jgi:hypothetical protein
MSALRIDLLKAVVDARLEENAALNFLQDRGAISDLCMSLADVAEADCPKAIEVLRMVRRRASKKL